MQQYSTASADLETILNAATRGIIFHRKSICILLTWMVVGTAGCSSDDAHQEPQQQAQTKQGIQTQRAAQETAVTHQPQASPDAAAVFFLDALLQSKREQLRHVLIGEKDEIDVILSVQNFGKEAIAFRETFIKSYGRDAWKKFQDPKAAPSDGDTTLVFGDADDMKSIQTSPPENDANFTFFTHPKLPSKIRIVRQDGGWLIDASSFLPPNAEPEKFQKMMRAWAEAVVKYRSVIGHARITAEDIDADLGKTMMKAMGFSPSGIEYRFDVDELVKKS